MSNIRAHNTEYTEIQMLCSSFDSLTSLYFPDPDTLPPDFFLMNKSLLSKEKSLIPI